MEFRTSKIKLTGLLVVILVLVGNAYFCTTLSTFKAQIAGWSGLAFFGFCGILIAWQLIKPNVEPVVTIDSKGIFDRRLKIGNIPWDKIEAVWIGAVRSQKFLCVETSDTKLIPSKLVAVGNHHLGFPPIVIGFTGLSPSLKEAWSYIKNDFPQKAIEKNT